jgi:hypothetical protein
MMTVVMQNMKSDRVTVKAHIQNAYITNQLSYRHR